MIPAVELLKKYIQALENVFDIAEFSPEEKKSLVAELTTSIFTKTFHAVTSSLPKDKDEYLANIIRNSTDPKEILDGFRAVVGAEEYVNILTVKAKEVLSGLINDMSFPAPEDIKKKFNSIQEEFNSFVANSGKN